MPKLQDFIQGAKTRAVLDESDEQLLFQYPAWVREELSPQIQKDPIKYAIWLNAKLLRKLLKTSQK